MIQFTNFLQYPDIAVKHVTEDVAQTGGSVTRVVSEDGTRFLMGVTDEGMTIIIESTNQKAGFVSATGAVQKGQFLGDTPDAELLAVYDRIKSALTASPEEPQYTPIGDGDINTEKPEEPVVAEDTLEDITEDAPEPVDRDFEYAKLFRDKLFSDRVQVFEDIKDKSHLLLLMDEDTFHVRKHFTEFSLLGRITALTVTHSDVPGAAQLFTLVWFSEDSIASKTILDFALSADAARKILDFYPKEV